jgi:1-acyl-sn-glycerol-3-phosphate acyltransferase
MGADQVYRFVNGVGRLALRALDVDVRWSGVEHLPAHGPVVLAATHVSYPDFVFLEKAAVTRGRYVRFMARHDVWEVPVVPWFMDRMRHIPVDRRAPAHAYLRARRLLRAGEAVCGFPEAGISFSYTVRPLMRGLVALARETGAPVVPVGVWGTQRIFSVGDPAPPIDWTRGRRVDLAFGPPVYVGPGDDLTERTLELGHLLTDLLEGLQQLPHHRPRPGEVASWYPAHLGGAAPDRGQALLLDRVPANAVLPTWGPDFEVYDHVSRRAPDASG